MQKKHADFEDGFGWIAENGAELACAGRTPRFQLSSKLLFVSKAASKLHIGRAPDWRKDWKAAHESTGTRGRLNRNRVGPRLRSGPW
jgi:hypothetical protein